MSVMDRHLPILSDALVLPLVRGTADLTDFAYQGHDLESLNHRIAQSLADNPAEVRATARQYDEAIALQLAFRRSQGLNLQDEVLEQCQMFRVGAGIHTERPLRLLALVGPGDLMVNTPLDFLTNHLNVRLDLLYLLPDRPLPDKIPDHDIAFFAISEADPATLDRLRALFAAWPRPVLNDPACLPALERDTLARSLAGIPGICSPTAVAVTRAALEVHLRSGQPIDGFEEPNGLYPCLIRPAGSHAGAGLARVASAPELAEYLRLSFGRNFFLTAFEDYSGLDGFYRKSRIAFIDKKPFLCHMAISTNWMVHYLNAGMTECAGKRAQEADAMANFDRTFAHRHAAAFQALHEHLGFDFYSIDCAETRDGRLLVFEADAAAIIHLMDPPDMFPYKQPQMHRVFSAFDTMLRHRTGLH